MDVFNQYQGQLFFCFEHAQKSKLLCTDPYCQVPNRIVCEKCIEDGPHIQHTCINIYELIDSLKQIHSKLLSFKYSEDIDQIKDQININFKTIRVSILDELASLETRLQNHFDEISNNYKNASQKIIQLQNLYNPENINQITENSYQQQQLPIISQINTKYSSQNLQQIFRIHQKILQKQDYEKDLVSQIPEDIQHSIKEELIRLSKLSKKVSETIKNWRFSFIEILDFNSTLFQGQVEHEFFNDSPVCEVTSMDDNDTFAVGDANGQIKVYKTSTKNRELCISHAHSNFISSLTALSEFVLASGSEDCTIKIWNLAQYNNNKELIIREEQRCMQILQGHQAQVTGIKKINEKLLISSSIDEKIRVWDYNDGLLIYTLHGHTKPITSILLYNLAENLLSCSGNGIIKAWKISEKIQINTIEDKDQQYATLCNLDSIHFACSTYQGNIIIWRYSDFQKILVIEAHEKQKNFFGLVSLNFSFLCSCSYDKTIKVWDWMKASCIGTLYGHSSEVEKIVKVNSHNIVSVGYDGKIILWK